MRTPASRGLAAITGLILFAALTGAGSLGAFAAGMIAGAAVGGTIVWLDRGTERQDAWNAGWCKREEQAQSDAALRIPEPTIRRAWATASDRRAR